MMTRAFYFDVLIVTKSNTMYAEPFGEGDVKHFSNKD